ncbi:response regulator transcription factor [Aliarcobacter vitoriensis]|uniref:DNA-binding response regulator n=1 Tax=Aliarcobacter vitoriensis TaxID=2011099 RepID=A0A366MT10_9BACT|nr:response regulator transcription factor [Aliarcobacter vitoriensis]RBQ29408.1 DNA-binding response regulator [Aliarcobacter vitoriensis]
MKNLKILYIEDEDFIRKNAIEYLSYISDFVYEAKDAIDGFDKYTKIKPDIIICDILMPKINGLELIEKIRKDDLKTQIIVVTARIDTEFLIKAVELKLVKYITKPICEDKLFTALKEASKNIENIFDFGNGVKFDLSKKTLIKNEKLIKLTQKEILFLEILLRNINRITYYQELENFVWKGYMSEDALRSVVKSLRKKLPTDALQNISKMGYQLKIV